MTFQRILRYGMSGSDVWYLKRRLFSAGYYDSAVTAVEKSRFGTDTLKAVRRFQSRNLDGDGKQLIADGVVGRKTWVAVERAALLERDAAIPANIGSSAAAAMTRDLSKIDADRAAMVESALQFAYDPAVPGKFPLSLYIWGGNLYDTNLMPNLITVARIDAGAKKQPQYYNGGRAQMMKAAVQTNPEITGADCSGGIIGLMRKNGIVKPTFDTTADTLTGNLYSAVITRQELRAGDWLGKTGHIGLYVGGGYAVEWAGGAYGCQLTPVDRRRAYDFVTGKMKNLAAWTKFRRPVFYGSRS